MISRASIRDRTFSRRLASVRPQPWWGPLLIGMLSIAGGCAILTAPWSVQSLAYFAAVVFIVRGIALAFNPIYRGGPIILNVLAALFGTLAGLWLLVWPGPSLLVLAIFIAAWITVSGAFNVITAISRRRDLPYWVLLLILGMAELLLGMWAMRRPSFSLALAITVAGFWAIITGVALCILALELRYLMTTAAAVIGVAGQSMDVHDDATSDPLALIALLHRRGLITDDELAGLMARVADRTASNRRRGA